MKNFSLLKCIHIAAHVTTIPNCYIEDETKATKVQKNLCLGIKCVTICLKCRYRPATLATLNVKHTVKDNNSVENDCADYTFNVFLISCVGAVDIGLKSP